MTPAEPQRVLQYFSWEDQERWQSTTPADRLEWLEFIITAAWAGAAHTETSKNAPLTLHPLPPYGGRGD